MKIEWMHSVLVFVICVAVYQPGLVWAHSGEAGAAENPSTACVEPHISATIQALQNEIKSGDSRRIGDVPETVGLAPVVTQYLEARKRRDVEGMLSFLVPDAGNAKEEDRRFYESTLKKETLVSFDVTAVRPPERGSSDWHVLAVVMIVVNGTCYQDVLGTLWRHTAEGWRLLPGAGIKSDP